MQQDWKSNKFLLIQVLLLDLIGFSLIFPVAPQLLDYYAKHNSSTDVWWNSAIVQLLAIIPQDESVSSIVILGAFLSSIYAVLQFLVGPLWGRLSDRIGRRPVLIITSFGLALSYVLWAVSPTFTWFLLSRVFGGIMAGNMGVASASMADMTTQKDRTSGMALLGAAFGVGFIIGPAIGGFAAGIDLSHYSGFFHPFSFCAILSFILSIFSATWNYFRFKETLVDKTASEKPWISNPFHFPKELQTFDFKFVVFLEFLFTAVFAAFEFTLTFFLKLDFVLIPREIGMIFFYLGLVLVFSQGFLVRHLSKVWQERSLTLLGIGLLPIPLVALAYTAPDVLVACLVLFPIGIGSAFVHPALGGLASIHAPSHSQGVAMGTFRSAASLGRALAPMIGGFIYWTRGVQTTYIVLGILLTCCVILSIFLKSPAKS